jgi:HAD superfamily hydrolase (TIGR01450 family)
MFTSFEEIADNYKAIFFDAFGVLKNSERVFAGVPELIVQLRQSGKEIFIITNDSSKSPERLARAYTLSDVGQVMAPERVISSGLLARDFLANKLRRGWVAYLGTEASAYYIEAAGLEPVPMSECREEHAPKALVLLDDEGFDWARDINKAINWVRRYHIPVLIANADLEYPRADSEVGVAIGGVGRLMEHLLRKTFIRFGKPDPMMFSYAYRQLLHEHPEYTMRDVLMVGDTLETDIRGANAFGVDTALVLSGNTRPDHVEVAVRASGIIPDFVCESVLT